MRDLPARWVAPRLTSEPLVIREGDSRLQAPFGTGRGRLEAAKAAAPYFAPRLAATKLHHQGTIGGTDLMQMVTPEQMEMIAREILLGAGNVFDD